MRLRFSVLLVLLVFVAVPVFAQAGGVAAISGVVRDPSGAVVPNAKVVISSEGQGTLRTLVTNDAGLFTAPALVPGPGYKVAVTASGFAPYEANALVLLVGQNMDLKVALEVATSATQVEVTAVTPLVEDTKSDVSGVVNERSIQDLPINGRRVDSFVLLTPGVTNDGYYGLLTFRGVAGQNSFLVDGTDTTEQFYNENAGRTRIVSQISQDAVQEFQVVSSNYSAEYGRAMGGVVNTVTRSGSNAFHGTAFWFYRSTAFDGQDPFSAVVASEKRNQAGATLGGPVKKDKLFFFLSTEVTRRDFPMTSSINTTALNGVTQSWNLCGVSSGSGTSFAPAATAAQCNAINALIPRFFGVIPRTLDQELYLGRLDYHLTDRHTLSATFNFLHDISPNGIQTGVSSTSGSAITSNGDDYVTVRNGRVAWTWVPTSNLVNEFDFGFASDRQADSFDQAELGSGLGYLQVSVNGTQLGPASYLPRVEPSESRFQFQDNASWTKGTHTIKFGADIATTEDYVYYITSAFGSYTYQTVNEFALDYSNPLGVKYWSNYSQTFGNPALDTRINDYGFYAEDQWRATPRLNLNYGVRYEYAQLPQPKVCNQDYPETCHLNSSHKNFAPRLGLSYRLNDKTVLQAGYGMFHARFQSGTIDDLFTTGNGLYQQSVSLIGFPGNTPSQYAAGPVFPNALSSVPSAATVASGVSLQEYAPNIKTPYSEQGNIGIQRQITSDMALTVSYLWSRGLQLIGVRDLNFPTQTTNFTYIIDNASASQVGTYTTPVTIGARPDTRYGAVYYDENGVNSYYNGLAVQVNKRFAHGLQGLFSYTWSHEIDDGQSYSESTDNLYQNSNTYWLTNGNYKADKGSGSEDQRHRAVISWVWQPVFTHQSGAFYKYFVNNWQLSSITVMESGVPYGNETITLSGTPVTGMFKTSTINGSGLSTRVPFLPYNYYYLPAHYNSDARLSKIIPLGENPQRKLYLTFEMFNISGSWSATSYKSSVAYTEAGGILTATPQNLYIPSADNGFPDGTQAKRMQVSGRITF
ncbi:MAG: TonB-dependent receptor [Bryobacteraceae bacterium]|jgi:outer membrane receptor protein involved in Fe transport